MRELRMLGSVRGAPSNGRPYRDPKGTEMPQQLRAFLAIPYRNEFTWIQNSIAAACRQLNVDLIRVDEKIIPGTSIVTAIHHFIQESDFAFVVLTGVNSNVVYELGLLHAGGGLKFEVRHGATCKVSPKWEPTTRT